MSLSITLRTQSRRILLYAAGFSLAPLIVLAVGVSAPASISAALFWTIVVGSSGIVGGLVGAATTSKSSTNSALHTSSILSSIMTNQSCSLLPKNIHVDTFVHVLSFLVYKDRCSVGKASKSLYKLTRNEKLWWPEWGAVIKEVKPLIEMSPSFFMQAQEYKDFGVEIRQSFWPKSSALLQANNLGSSDVSENKSSRYNEFVKLQKFHKACKTTFLIFSPGGGKKAPSSLANFQNYIDHMLHYGFEQFEHSLCLSLQAAYDNLVWRNLTEKYYIIEIQLNFCELKSRLEKCDGNLLYPFITKIHPCCVSSNNMVMQEDKDARRVRLVEFKNGTLVEKTESPVTSLAPRARRI